MIPPETVTRIRHLFFAEHWKIGTIAAELGLHHETVRGAVETDRFNRAKMIRPTQADPYMDFIRATLEQYPGCGPHGFIRCCWSVATPAAWWCCGAWWPGCGPNPGKPS